jgi:hypothetical protein
MRLLSFMLGLLLLFGCATRPQPSASFQVLSRRQVNAFICGTNNLWSAAGETTSSSFAVPTSQWIRRTVSPRLDRYLFNNHSRVWVYGENDCVAFSVHGVSEAYTAYHNEPKRIEDTCLAVGTFDYDPHANLTNSHEIMFFIINDGNGFELKFYEPQRRDFVKLSTNELFSAYHWRM